MKARENELPKIDRHTISELTTAVFDNGRRGNPKPGCDCRQCFGYCMIDGDEAFRQISLAVSERTAALNSMPMNFTFGEANADA